MKDDTENKLNEGFISRWSKRKSSEKSDQNKNKSLEDNDKENKSEDRQLSTKEELDENQYDELNDKELLDKFELPDPEKIKKEKGLDLFFKDGVPDRLRQIALRRVWKLNPIIRFADAEINDYHEDFTDAATVIEGMQTAYQVGRGYLSEIIKEQDEDISDDSNDNLEKESKKTNSKPKAKVNKASKSKIKNEVPLMPNENKNEVQNLDATNLENNNAELETVKAIDLSNNTVEAKPAPKMMVFKPRNE